MKDYADIYLSPLLQRILQLDSINKKHKNHNLISRGFQQLLRKYLYLVKSGCRKGVKLI